jgi:hypothetical protein
VPELGVLLATPFRGLNEGTPMTISRHVTETHGGPDAGLALGLDALRIGRLLRDPVRWPARWSQPSFGAEVERCRRPLARIRSRQDLEASYGREVFVDAEPRADAVEGSPVRVAYALRWIELQDGVTGPSWPALAG